VSVIDTPVLVIPVLVRGKLKNYGDTLKRKEQHCYCLSKIFYILLNIFIAK
jgi:hypothetical protein